MAQYVLAGIAECPNYARAEILADNLSLNLPDFKVHKVCLSESDWAAWLSKTCGEHGWEHTTSPLVWRELVDRGGAGTYLGGWDNFRDMAEHWYSFKDQLDGGKVTNIAAENSITYEKDKAASVKSPVNPVRICVLGAAQPLAYQILPLLLDNCFQSLPVSYILCDVESSHEYLEGVKMELEDCAFNDLHTIDIISDTKKAVRDADYILVLDHLDSSSHPNRFQLIKAVNEFYRDLAGSLKGNVKAGVKVIINGYKGCLGGMLLHHYDLKDLQISVIVTLDEQRMRSKLAKRLSVLPEDINYITVWGNVPVHGIADTTLASVRNHEGAIAGPVSYRKTVDKAVNEGDWEKRNVDTREIRDSQLLKLSGRKPDLASSQAVYRHIEALVQGSDAITMGCVSDGQYGTTAGAVFGFPVQIEGGVVGVREVEGLSDNTLELITLQDRQLTVEKQVALGECDDVQGALEALEDSLWQLIEDPKLKRALEEREATRLADEEAERKAEEIRAKEEATRKQEEEALKQAEEELAAAQAAAAADEDDDDDDDEDEE